MVGIEDHNLTADHLKEECRKFMERIEANAGNTKQQIYDGIKPDNIEYLTFDDD